MRSRALGASLVLLVVFATRVAHAQDAETTRLVEEGLALRRQNHDDQAIAPFQRAYAQSRLPMALAQQALSEQRVGRWVDADEHMRAVLATSGDSWVDRHRSDLAPALVATQSHLGEIEVLGGVPGAVVRIDGRVRATLPMQRPVRATVGTAVVEIVAAGYHPVTRSVIVTARQVARETVELVPLPQSGASTNGETQAPSADLAANAAPAAVNPPPGPSVVLNEDFSHIATGDVPPGWSGNDNWGVRVGDDGSHLLGCTQPGTGQTWRITIPRLPADYRFEVLVEGNGPFLVTIGAVVATFEGSQSRFGEESGGNRDVTLLNATGPSLLVVERRGNVHRIFVGESEVDVRRFVEPSAAVPSIGFRPGFNCLCQRGYGETLVRRVTLRSL